MSFLNRLADEFVHVREWAHDLLCLALGTPLLMRCAMRFDAFDPCMDAACYTCDPAGDGPLFCKRHADELASEPVSDMIFLGAKGRPRTRYLAGDVDLADSILMDDGDGGDGEEGD